jgi:archaeosortase B (VPXXXP-CTERM-specific)
MAGSESTPEVDLCRRHPGRSSQWETRIAVKRKSKSRPGGGDQHRSIRAKLRSHKTIIRFCLIFLALLVILALVFPFLSDKLNPQLTWLMAATAGITGGCLRLLGLAAGVSGRIVTLPNFSIEVVGECTGLYEMLIFLAAVIAYPAGWRKKVLGAGLGIPLLYVINIVRMVFITAVGNWSPGTFEFMHLYFWQVAMILIIVAVWVLWIEKVVHRERKAVVVHS